MARLSAAGLSLLNHYAQHPRGVRLKGKLHPLTQAQAHVLAPRYIPPAPIAPPTTFGIVPGGGRLGVTNPQTQAELELPATAEDFARATSPAPDYIRRALAATGVLPVAERARAARIGGEENLGQPADLTNLIVGAATLGVGPDLLAAGKAADVGADALAGAGGTAATTTADSTATQVAKAAGRAVTAPIRHPIVTSTAPVAAQVPAALERGNPNQLLYGLEGSGVLASALGGAGKKVQGAIPGVVGNAASDLINLPAQALPSIYLSGQAGINALTGHSEQLDKQVQGFKEQSPLYALATGHLGQAASDVYNHPIYSYLEGEGLKSGVGNLLGRAGSAAGVFQRNEPRPGLGIYGERVNQRGPYSNDFFRKVAQKRGDARRGPAPHINALKWVDEHTAHEPAPVKASQREITNYLNEFADSRSYANEGYRKGRRDKRRAELEEFKPENKADREVVGLQAQGIISHDPDLARVDLANYRKELVDAQHHGVEALDGSHKILTKSQIKQNRSLVAKIGGAIKNATLDNKPTLEAMAKLDRELSGKIIEKGIGLPGGEQQARIARAVPHAARFLESKYGLSRSTALELAQEEAEGRPIGSRASKLRAQTQVLDKNGDALNIDDIEKSMRDNGIDPDLVSYVSNKQPLEAGVTDDNAGIHFQPPDERGQLRSRSRTGSAVAKGLIDPSYEAALNQVTHGGTLVDRAANYDQNLNVNGVRRPDGKQWANPNEAADALAHPEDYGMKPLPEIPGGYVFMPATPWPASSGALDATEGLGRSVAEPTDEVGRTTEADPQEIEGLHYDPVDGAEFSERAHSAIVKFGTKEAEQSTRPGVIVPKTVANRLAEHYAKSTTFEKSLQKLVGTFKGAVLPTSVKWLAGNAVDNWLVRSLLSGTITDIPTGVRFARHLKSVLDEKGPEAAERAIEEILPGTVYSSVARTQPFRGADQFIGTKIGPLASALHKFFEAPGVNSIVNAWHYYRDTVFHLDSKYIERLPQYGALGKAARREVDMTRGQFKRAIADQEPALKDLAEGFRNPDTVDRFAKDVERIFGNWGRNSPEARRFYTTYSPFWQWARAATKFVYLTLPRDHPVLTSLLAASQTMTREERLKFGFDFDAKNPLPDWMQGSIPGSKGGVFYSNLTSFQSFGNPANFFGSNLIPPIISPAALALGLGVDWQGQKLVKTNGEPMDDVEKAKVAAVSTAESFIPFMTVAKNVLGGKAEHSINPVRSYPKSTVELEREHKQEISVPVKESEPGSSAGASNGALKFVEGLESQEESGAMKFVEGLE